MVFFIVHIGFDNDGLPPPVGDMAGDTNCFSGLRIADEIHGHGYSDHRRTYGGTGNAGYGVRQGYQDTAMEAAGVVIVFGGVCFQAYRHAAAVDFIYLTRQGRGLQDGRAASSPESQLYDIR